MKDLYAEKVLNDEGLFRSLFTIVWNKRETRGEPEIYHPDWDEVREAIERITDGTSKDNAADLWSIIRCYAETYYLTGLREGANMIHTLLPISDVQPDGFGSHNASQAEIKRLRQLLDRLVTLDPAKKDFAEQIDAKTYHYTHITKKACLTIIDSVTEMIENYESRSEE